MIEDPDDLIERATKERRQSHYAEAALLYARGREAALNLSDHARAFEAGLWQADCRRMQNRFQEALALLLPLLANPPSDAQAFDRWLAHDEAFAILLSIRPELSRLRNALDDMIEMGEHLTHPAGDIPYMEGQLSKYQGQFAAALDHYAKAWQENDGSGYYRHNAARWAAYMAMALNRGPEARAWRDHLAHLGGSEPSALEELRATNSLLALFAQDCSALAECREEGCEYKEIEARVHLALRGASKESLDDPFTRFHPARAALRNRPSRNVQTQYDYRLAVVDYHLASLRYVTGLPAVDDLYYQQPDVVPSRLFVADRASFASRLKHFHRSWRRLDKHARWLDGLLKCDYRARESESRLLRCN